MKKFIFIFIFFLSHCSFDNKTGIWENSTKTVKNTNEYKDFKNLYTREKLFSKIINPTTNLKLNLKPIVSNKVWHDKYFNSSNNLSNYSYNNLNKLVFKSKKLTRYNINNGLLFDDDKIITSDSKGNVIVYSIQNKKIILKFNFYKKKFKKKIKKLNIIFEKNIIYVGDNLGYLYALDLIQEKILWAKNVKVPIRSNLKIVRDKILLADINNSIYFINKSDGDSFKTIPTEEKKLKSNFISSFAFNKNSILYLNTNGSLYSLTHNGKINWFLSLNQSIDLNTNNLFYSNPIVINDNKIIVSTEPYLYVFNAINGLKELKLTISSSVKPFISGENLFLITKNNLLVCINVNNGKIIYSIDVIQKIADFLKTKKKSISINFASIINNNLYLFLNNSYFVKFSPEGVLIDINKLPSRLNSYTMFVKNVIIYINKNNKLIIVN
jgi:outer membrane protein assembly factor BamB